MNTMQTKGAVSSDGGAAFLVGAEFEGRGGVAGGIEKSRIMSK